ncbi:MAG: hypothetical protein HOQ29_08775, partial [Acidobacteria bacterium]|nr:hypothetical protein [Acidobacteriota bacterium]
SSVAGTFVYTPVAGTTLSAGANQTLSVTFTPTDAVNYTTATKTVTINVLKGTPAITWAPPADITYGTTLSATQLNATSSTPGTFVYAPAAATTLKAGANQTLSVTFTPTDAVNYTTATKTVTINVLKGTPTITWAPPADIAYGTALSASQLNATSSTPGSFVYAPAAGTTLNVGASQTLTVTFTPTDAANYTTASKTVTINVVKATPTITWPAPADITSGTALSATQLNATSSTAGTFVYTPAAGTILSAGANQTLSVTFTPTDAVNYVIATKTVSINVVKATPAITWANPADITYGAPLGAFQLNAAATVAGTWVYTPAEGTVLNAGSAQRLSVTFFPTDAVNYSTTTKDVFINVLKVTPIVTWRTPLDIVQGTALSATQLNATASVPGTFVYTPSAGTVLAVGVWELSTVFTPADSNYATTTASVILTVKTSSRIKAAIQWTNPSDITYGTALGATQLNATAVDPQPVPAMTSIALSGSPPTKYAKTVPGRFVYNPPKGTFLEAGTHTLSVTFVPADSRYDSVSAQRSIRVNLPPVPPASKPPFGFLDTPADGASGLSGSVAITGWALDDIGVAAVEIFRDALPNEPPAQVMLGTATMVDGARPDVQAQFPNHPFASRGGWGYMLLTNMLPNGGTGFYRFHVYARDVEGHRTLLGSRTVFCANDQAKLPFGAIDTPAQGAIVSGTIINWGWALTPQPGSIAADGSTIDVVIDDVRVGHPAFGLQRADITSLFPGYKNTNSAVGYFVIDTTQLSNGTHTLAWAVRDSLGRVQGIGSRFINVRNDFAAATVLAATTTAAPIAQPAGAGAPPAMALPSVADAEAATTTPASASTPRRAVASNATTLERTSAPQSVSSSPGAVMSMTTPPTVTTPRLMLRTPVVVEGADVRIEAAAAPRGWVGVYAAGASDTTMLDRAEIGVDGRISFAAPGTPGTYELRLFESDSFTRMTASAPLIVSPAPQLIPLASELQERH